MQRAFSAPIDVVSFGDIEALKGWPESNVTEFKGSLSVKKGDVDVWATQNKLTGDARDAVFKEVVALANGSGGHLVLGVSEDSSDPSIAGDVTPVPSCLDLASRLERAAQAIDPPIPLLSIRGIPAPGSGDGVVIFRIPASRLSPHRSTDRHCYVRQGTSSAPMNMSQIKTHILATGSRDVVVSSRFAEFQKEFQRWIGFAPKSSAYTQTAAGFRISLIPISQFLNLPRLYGRVNFDLRQHVKFAVDGMGEYEGHVLRKPERKRAIIRGVRYLYTEDESPSVLEMHCDGSVNINFKSFEHPPKNSRLYLQWLLGYLANGIAAVEWLRADADMPECEYGIEIELACSAGMFDLYGWPNMFEEKLATFKSDANILLPRLSYGLSDEENLIYTTVATDFHDAAGAFQPEVRKITRTR